MKRFQVFIVCLLGCFVIFAGCNVVINKTSVEINIKQGTKSIPCTSGYFDFGNVPINSVASAVTFTIENLSDNNLLLSGGKKIIISGSFSDQFSSDYSQTSTVVGPGSSTTFTISFKPTSYGKKTATVSIRNNDAGENPYTFLIIGTGTSPAPEIHVKQGGTDIPSPTGTYSFGYVPLNTPSGFVIFTIYNYGNNELILTGNPNKIKISGIDSAMFTINQQSILSTIPVGGSTSFSISFKPTKEGEISASVLILSNDSDENPYTFKVSGGVYEIPEINVREGNTDIPNGSGGIDFGKVLTGNVSAETVFIVENLGTSNLFLSGTPEPIKIIGSDTTEFEINQSLTNKYIFPGGSTTFTVKFKPTSGGKKSVTISIANNDIDENPYTFAVTGTAIEPEISIKKGTRNIANTTGIYDFKSEMINSVGTQLSFSIENLGTADLHLTGSPIVELKGADANQFNLNISQTSSPILPGSDTVFSIAFAPTSLGSKSATVSIKNDDADENPYTFTITGVGSTFYEGDINGDSYPDIIVGASGDDDGGSSSGCAFIFFGKRNWTPKIDAANADVKLVGENSTDYFGKSVSFAGDVNKDGIGDLIVGAYYGKHGSASVGCAYIFFGRKNWPSTLDASNADVKIRGGNTSDTFGYSVSDAGDVNDDSFDDIIIGAYGADGGGSSSGEAYIFFGRSNWSGSMSATNANVKLIGEYAGDYFGATVSEAGDINDDGVDDVIVGAYNADNGGSGSGCAYIFFGSANWGSVIDASNASVKLIGESVGDYLGYGVSYAGDVNCDGKDDILVGAHGSNLGGTYSGCVYIFFGKKSWSADVKVSNADVKIIGQNSNDYFGRAVTCSGDINNDGLDDILLGASYDDDGGNSSGCAFIFFGRTNWDSVVYASNASVKLIGEDAGDLFGTSLNTFGDINRDGISDIIIGASSDDDGGSYSGCAFIFFGKQSWGSSVNASNANVKLVGADSLDSFHSVK